MHSDAERPDDIEVEERDGFLEVRFLGVFKSDRFNRQVDAAVRACQEKKLTLLLIDATGLLRTKISSVDRFEIGSHGARVASHLKIAVCAPPGLMDPKKFAAQVAQNRGLMTDTFADRQKAVDWLLSPT